MHIDEFLQRLEGVRKTGNGYTARCPSHEDKNNSLSIKEGDEGRILVHCFAGCEYKDIMAALNLSTYCNKPSNSRAYLHNRKEKQTNSKGKGYAEGMQLCRYASHKRIPEDVLKGFGLSDYRHKAYGECIRIPYYNADRQEDRVRYRIVMSGDKFRWRKGDKVMPYGLWTLNGSAEVTICEGESDCHTLWHTGFNALGIPGASTWKEAWAEHLEQYERINVIVEPDTGGKTVVKKLSQSRIRHRAFLVDLGADKDPSNLFIKDTSAFRDTFQRHLDSATPWQQVAEELAEKERAEAWDGCKELAKSPDVLSVFELLLPRLGLVGESRNAKLIFLALISRTSETPISIVVEGPSSSGKSFLVKTVLQFFPESAFIPFTTVSEHSLIYNEDPFEHRHLVFYELAGFKDSLQEKLIRMLLSEGCIRHGTVEKTGGGLKHRMIIKEGPSGLITTTCDVWRNPENETRLLALSTRDTPGHTAEIFKMLADESTEAVNLDTWHKLNTWLQYGDHRVTIPYAMELAEKTLSIAVRQRRDFGKLLTLIRSHALLHKATRERDREGQIIATIDDYAAIRELTVDIFGGSVGATVKATIRETVEAVRDLVDPIHGPEHVTKKKIAAELELHQATADRRINEAVSRGYLKDLDAGKRGIAHRIELGDPLPEDQEILPKPDDLFSYANGPTSHAYPQDAKNTKDSSGLCSNASNQGGYKGETHTKRVAI